MTPSKTAFRGTASFALVCLLFLVGIEFVITRPGTTLLYQTDFRSFYSAGYLIRTDRSHLYDLDHQNRAQNEHISPGGIAIPYFHPSYEALIYAPFSLLSYRTAYRAFLVFNFSILWITFFIGRDHLWRPHPALLCFSFLPLWMAVVHGQNSLLMLLLCCLAWKQIERGNSTKGGMILGLALFKFQLILPIAILLACRRGGRSFAKGFALTGTFVAIFSVAIVGWSGTTSLIRLLHTASLAGDQSMGQQTALAIHPFFMPNISGALYALGTRALSPQLAFGIVSVASLYTILWATHQMKVVRREEVAFCIAVLCGLLVSGHVYIHDVTLLFLPMALVGSKHPKIVLSAYALPLILLLTAHLDRYFLMAFILVALLAAIASQARSRPSQAKNEYEPPPLSLRKIAT